MNDPHPIEATVEIGAPAEAVWALVSDVRRMPEFSPELRKVWALGRATGTGARFLGGNRRGAAAWPTLSTVVRWEPARRGVEDLRERRHLGLRAGARR